MLLASCAMPAGAQEIQEKPWEFEVEVGAEREPAYVGSDNYSTEADIGIKATYTARNGTEWYLSTGGVGVTAQLPRDYELTLELEYEPGRDNADDPILTGFPEMKDTWEFQAVLVRQLGDFQLGLGVQQDILGHGKGLVGFAAAGYSRQLSDRLRFRSILDVSFANAKHMNTEVGITPAASQITGLSGYTASGGFKSTSLQVGFDYAVSRRTELYMDLAVERYGSAIADSPLVRDHGSRTTTEVGAGMRFRF